MIALLAAIAGFANLTPDAAQTAALSNSPDVAAARARVEQSAAQLAATRDVIAPSLLSSYAQVPQGNPPGPAITSRLVTVGLQTTIADFLGYSASVRQAVLALAGARADADVAVRSERIKTVGLYYDALRNRGVAEARARALQLAERARDAARTRFAAGDAPRLDVLRADVAVSKAIADFEAARVNDENATEALRVETGVPDATDLQAMRDDDMSAPGTVAFDTADTTALAAAPVSANAAAAPLVSAPYPSVAAVRDAALVTRAEIVSADAAVNAAAAARAVARTSGLPAIVASGGYTSGTDSGVQIGGPSINVSLTLPIGGANTARVRAQNAQLAEARARASGARRTVLLEVTSAARSVAALERAAAASSRARAGADAELAAAELGYRSGASSSFELAGARDVDTQARVDEVSARYDLAKARATLRLEIGR